MQRLLLLLVFITVTTTNYAQGIFNSSIHTATNFGSVNSPGGEQVQNVIDQNSNTKFLDFNANDGIGFQVDMLGVVSRVTSMVFVTANDAPERDPTNYQIFGSNDGSSFTSIATGSIPCTSARLSSRTFSFSGNTNSYTHYRVNFTGTCGTSSILQIADVQLVNTCNIAINSQPQDVSVIEGSDASFTVAATGVNLMYQWFSNDTSTALVGETNATLTLSNVQLTDDGKQYFVRAYSSNSSCFEQSNPVTLTVDPCDVAIMTPPQDASVIEGGDASFNVAASGTNVMYQWYGEGESITNKTTSDGLGNNICRDIYESNGTMYVATEGGLSISTDGGNTFTNKTTTDGLGNNSCQGVYESNGTIYVATRGGLSISTDAGNSFTNKTTTDGLGSNSCQDVYESNGTIYVATIVGGLSISTDGGNSFTNKTTTDGLGNNTCYGVYESNGTIYVATEGGLSISTNGGNTFTNKTTTDGLGSNTCLDVYESNGTIYVATSGDLSISTDSGNTFTNRTTADGLGSNSCQDVYESNGIIYVATTGGLSISTDAGNTFTNKTTTDGLGSNDCRGVYESNGTIYATTFGGGLSIISPFAPIAGETNATLTLSNVQLEDDGSRYFVEVFSTPSCSVQSNLAFLTVNPCDIAINTQPQDVTTIEGSNASFNVVASGTNSMYQWFKEEELITNKNQADGLGSNVCYGVYESNGTMYVATLFGGLSISTDGGNTFTNKTTIDGLGNNSCQGVYESNGIIYVATNGGLSISTDGGNTFTNKTTADGLGNNICNGVYESNGTIYVATNGGLSISTNGGNTFTTKTTTDGLGNNVCQAVYESNGTIYVATNGGLSISTDGGNIFTNKTTTDGLVSNECTSVYESNGTIYVTTFGGLSISTDGGNSFTNKTTADGLVDNLCTGVYESNGSIYVATYGGMSISTDGGNIFTNKTTADGLVSDNCQGVYESNSTIYVVAGDQVFGGGGLSIISSSIPLVGETDATLTLNNVQLADDGSRYFVEVFSNSTCNAQSNLVTLNVNTCDIAINTQPQDVSVTEGSNASFSVGASGSNNMYQWYREEELITNRTTADGLGNNICIDVYESNSTIYVATLFGGLSISTDGGNTFTNKTTADGLGSNNCQEVYESNGTIYVATQGSLSISTDGGNSFTNKTSTDGLGTNNCQAVYAYNGTIYAATSGGLSISTDGGNNFTNKTTADGLGANNCRDVYESNGTLYIATNGGLSISTNGGNTFTNKTTIDGLGNNSCQGVYESNGTIYVATFGGLSISTNGGNTFMNKTTADGLGSNDCQDVYESNGAIYVATTEGLSISTDGGTTFTNKTTADGLAGNLCRGVYESDGTTYVATSGGGLSIISPIITPLVGGTSATLTLNNVQLADDGSQYFVEVFNTSCNVQSNLVTLTVDETLGVDTNTILEKLSLYPNPTHNVLAITGLKETKEYVIYDIQGSEILQGKITNNQPIHIEKLQSGVYFLKLKDVENVFKFIKL
ncbi:T9SS type A sorting domain-containing protein [Kordia sp.]|uniref:T9SS type A sorting domain-containing protein n=1 Tax=Kordia sp. TaxID=1965332 RepID=UPI003B5BB148